MTMMRKLGKVSAKAKSEIMKGVSIIPKGRITPVFKSSMKTTTPMMKKSMPKKAMPMNYKNPKYKPSNGVGVGY